MCTCACRSGRYLLRGLHGAGGRCGPRAACFSEEVQVRHRDAAAGRGKPRENSGQFLTSDGKIGLGAPGEALFWPAFNYARGMPSVVARLDVMASA
jgi:hypothetical protein